MEAARCIRQRVFVSEDTQVADIMATALRGECVNRINGALDQEFRREGSHCMDPHR